MDSEQAGPPDPYADLNYPRCVKPSDLPAPTPQCDSMSVKCEYEVDLNTGEGTY